MRVRLDKTTDVDELMRWRAEVIENVFGMRPMPSLLEANRQYYSHLLPRGEHYALIASADGEACGCGGVCFGMELPSPDNPTGKCAYLMNIYVRKPFRNKGIAHTIVKRLVEEAVARTCGKIYLETTSDGRSVYKSLGFHEMTDMMKYTGYDTED